MKKVIHSYARCLLIVIILPVYTSVFARDYVDDETTSPKTVEDIIDPFELGLEPRKKLLPKLEQLFEDTPPFLRDAYLTPHLRGYSFSRNTDNESDPDTIALGGEIRFLSGQIMETFKLGASYYISHGIHENDGEDTLPLGSNASDINTLGQLYLDVEVKDALVRLYRQSFSLPYLNKQDNRMVPNTHEAYVVTRDNTNLDFILGHVSQIKTRNSEGFISMAEAAGANGKSNGLHMLGARYNLDDSFNIGAITYYTEDVSNIFYSEFNYTKIITDGITAKLSGQYTQQESVGDEHIGEFDTHHIGMQVQAGYKNAILTLAATNTGSDAAIRSPFGGRPGYLSLMLQDFDRANETGFLVGLSYDFSRWGLPGLSGYINYAEGDTAEDPVTGIDLPDLSEYDITIDIKPTAGVFNGLWLRLRHARADFDGGIYTKDNRVILNYEMPLKNF